MDVETQAVVVQKSDKSSQTAADLLVDYLIQLQVDYVFGVPGGAIEPFYDALARGLSRGGPKAVTARHESGAAFMADGYHYQTGKLGVCCATTGPGVTNMITGIATAYANKVPLLVLSAQTALPTFGRGAVQESSCTGIDTVALLKHCCRYSSLVSHAEQIEQKIIAAVMAAFGPTPGPVHLSFPMDVMKGWTPYRKKLLRLDRLIQKQSVPSQDMVDSFFARIVSANKCVFIIGDGCHKAAGNIQTVASALGIELITTPHGKGLINPTHPYYRGVLGFAGHDDAVAVLENPEVDLVVCIGTLMGEWASNGWDALVLDNDNLIHVDQYQENFVSTPNARQQIFVNLYQLFAVLCEKVLNTLETERSNPFKTAYKSEKSGLHFTLDDTDGYVANAVPIKPQRLMKELPSLFPADSVFVADCGNSFAWAIHYLHPVDRRLYGLRVSQGGLFRACMEFAPMGWAIGCAVGMALADRERTIVCITGDGSVLMSGQELSVAVYEKLSMIFVVLNDASLGMVKHGQRLTGGEPIAYELPNTDFVAIARAMGAEGLAIESVNDLQALKPLIAKKKGPVLLDVRIDVEEVPPIGKRIKMLTNQ